MNPNGWILIRELIYELVRQEHFPNKPSRFDSLFLCKTESELTDFRTNPGRQWDIGYEVQLVDPQAPSHLGDWNVVNTQVGYNSLDYEKLAQTYWQANNISKPELLTTSPIRIVRIL